MGTLARKGLKYLLNGRIYPASKILHKVNDKEIGKNALGSCLIVFTVESI